jgi:hypothetical protein
MSHLSTRIKSMIAKELAEINEAIKARRHPDKIQSMIVALHEAMTGKGEAPMESEVHPAVEEYTHAYQKFLAMQKGVSNGEN